MMRYEWQATLSQAQVFKLYDSVGWSSYTQDMPRLMEGLEHSMAVLSAWEDSQLVGLIRAVGDEQTIVYIQDILVLPEYQRHGIGTQLVRQLLDKYRSVRQKVLLTDDTEKTIQFYKSCGLLPAPELQCCCFVRDEGMMG